MSRISPLVLLLASLVATGCVSTVRPPGAAKSRERLIVDAVTFSGIRSFEIDEILEGLALRPPEGRVRIRETLFDRMSLRLDVQRIESFLRRRGFFSARVTEVKSTKRGKDRIAIHYSVVEGSPTVIEDIQLAQITPSGFSEPELIAQTRLRPDVRLVYEDYENARDQLLAFLVRRGYVFARVQGSVEVDETKHRARVLFRVDAGARVRFGALTIEGNRRVPQEAILSRLAFREGDPFSDVALEKTKDALYKTGLFSSAQFDFSRDPRIEKADIKLRLSEGHRNEFKASVGAGVDAAGYDVHGRVGFNRKSFLLPMATLQTEVEPSCRRFDGVSGFCEPGVVASGTFAIDDFLITHLRLTNSVAYVLEPLPAYEVRGPRASVGLGYRFFDDRLQVSTIWQLQYLQLLSVDGNLDAADRALLGLEEPYRVGTFAQRLTFDVRDNILAPTRGVFAQLEVEESGTYSGSAFDYIRATPEIRAYYPLTGNLVLAGRLRYGQTFTRGVLPISQRYFAGGASSQRGFGARRLSPSLGSPDSVPVGGKAQLEASAELRLGSVGWERLGLVGFVDAGDVTLEPSDLDPLHLHLAAGGGARLKTPVGVIRLDLAYRLNRKTARDPDPDRPFGFAASIGEAF